jgi:signal transduction histidine kinase
MTNRIEENYFLVIRIVFLFVFTIFGIINSDMAGASFGILLLNMSFVTSMIVKELLNGKWKIIPYGFAIVFFCILISVVGRGYILSGFLLVFEILSDVDAGIWGYILVAVGGIVPTPIGQIVQLTIVALLAICYIQHYFVVLSYKKQMQEDTIIEQNLKRDIYRKDAENKAEMRRNMLLAENRLLEERSKLSQTLHDKLGHSINGSIYQLEAIKVLMEKDPEKSRIMLQGVIDQMRGGMDEIRAILRKERPEKKDISMLQLYRLTEECNEKGIEMSLSTSGDTAQIPENIWEVILDNTFEAVTNSMKYAQCTRIDVNIVVMNKMIRCSISDNGLGCKDFTDGMGISGMRSRVRNIGGTLSFETDRGFAVNMLLPL